MEIQRNYYAVIPATVMRDKTLSANAKLLYGEISALANEKGYCFASNDYFSTIYECSKRSIQQRLARLEKSGYIHVVVDRDDNKNVIERRIYLAEVPTKREVACCMGKVHENFTTSRKKVHDAHEKKCVDLTKKSSHIILHNNNTMNNIDHFDILWKLYPRKLGKRNAEKAYQKAIKEGVSPKDMQDGILRYIEHIKKHHIESQFIKHASTWFNQRGWEDEYTSSYDTNETEHSQKTYEEQMRDIYGENWRHFVDD
ncbi:helix-turn-helix domain-containing protein [Carnobacteriaceae bacterium zg-ZUI78]|nr:helix-turn-helix domain-containing protein [Carnobacteriaceae bacterium zg-ZUI78]